MKILYRLYYLFICVCLFVSLPSCKKFVEAEIPKTLLFTENTFNSSSTATSALTAIYSQMQTEWNGFNVALYSGTSSDELKSYSTYQPLVEFYANNIQPTNATVKLMWSNYYKYIYQANAVIEGVGKSSGISATIKNQLTGEAKFVRAFCYFYLTNFFGDVPLVLSTDYNANLALARAPQLTVYDQVIQDLKEAKDLLNNDYLSIDNVTISAERVRPNKYTAEALLARTYLYKKDWTNAEVSATTIIGNKTLYDLAPLANVFLKPSNEAIWQIQSALITPEATGFILTGAPATNVNGTSTISQSLYNSFEINDQRKTQWIGSVVVGSNVYNFPAKYKVASGSTVTEYSVVFRLSEIYLIRAEARAQLNKLAECTSDLNQIRARAGLPATSAVTQSALVDAILNERRSELFAEWGHRWFDLKRTGKIDAVMSAYAASKSATWVSSHQLLPIPLTEILNNNNLTQNSGY